MVFTVVVPVDDAVATAALEENEYLALCEADERFVDAAERRVEAAARLVEEREELLALLVPEVVLPLAAARLFVLEDEELLFLAVLPLDAARLFVRVPELFFVDEARLATVRVAA